MTRPVQKQKKVSYVAKKTAAVIPFPPARMYRVQTTNGMLPGPAHPRHRFREFLGE